MWEDGVEHPQKQDDLLDSLSAAITEECRIVGNVKLWRKAAEIIGNVIESCMASLVFCLRRMRCRSSGLYFSVLNLRMSSSSKCPER